MGPMWLHRWLGGATPKSEGTRDAEGPTDARHREESKDREQRPGKLEGYYRQRELQLKEEEIRQAQRQIDLDRRRLLIQAVGGAALLIGLLFTWTQTRDTKSDQITERFSRAVDQLGNADAVDVRMGGVYALERIARDSHRDRQAITEILSAFAVRSSRASPDQSSPAIPTEAGQLSIEHPRLERAQLEPDLDAAITVLGRILPVGDATFFNLSRADLSGMTLEGNFRGATFTGTTLESAFFGNVDLTGAFFESADLTNAHMASANLTDAYFNIVNVTGADLRESNLEDADVRMLCTNGGTRWPRAYTPRYFSPDDTPGSPDTRDVVLRGCDLPVLTE